MVLLLRKRAFAPGSVVKPIPAFELPPSTRGRTDGGRSALPVARTDGDGPDFDWTRHISEDAKASLFASAATRNFADRTTIYSPGDAVLNFYQVVTGAIRQFVVDADGQEVLIYIYQAGEFVADSSALDGLPYPVWIETKGATCVRSWSAAELGRLQSQFPEVAAALVRQLSQRLHIALVIIQQLSTLSAPGRIAARIDLLRRHCHTDADGMLSISQSDLAAMTNSTRQTVNETLAELRSLGVIETSYRGIHVVDPAALENFSRLAGRERRQT